MGTDFRYDVFLSHSSKDKDVVREIANRLKADSVRVWFDEWEIQPGDNIPHKLEEGLEHSRMLVLCMSAQAFGSDWAQLESNTFRFRDPLNQSRRFIPLRLDDAPLKGSLSQFSYIDWATKDQQKAYAQLLTACKPNKSKPNTHKTANNASPDKKEPPTHPYPAPFTKDELELKIRSLGHTGSVYSVAFSPDGTMALSGADDSTVRLWDVNTGQALRVFEGHTDEVNSVAFSPDATRYYSSAWNGVLRIWPSASTGSLLTKTTQIEYTNAKVLLVGNSAAGKTGLSNRLAMDTYTETDSTVGAWATQWKLPIESDDGVEKEVWLWDFGGQADQRLIHQLYMDQTQVAALVFDPQKPDLLEGLRTWERDLARAATGNFRKLLVAGRIDAGRLRDVSRHKIEEFVSEYGFEQYIETSAKDNTGCKELKEAICQAIDWDSIAKRTTPKLFKRLKEEIVALKDEGRTLMRFNELREALTLRMSGETFTDAELKAVISLLAGPGAVWELGFGSWVLLAPELINAYAQSVIRTVQEDEDELGCITEECVLSGNLSYTKDFNRLPEEEERILLLAMHQLLVQNSLCLSEPTKTGTLLIFPSYARRERPELIEHPSVMVSYQFE
ncbi:MAG: TIR domain-containing protein, partial [Cyanobacteria bacterium J06635_11]